MRCHLVREYLVAYRTCADKVTGRIRSRLLVNAVVDPDEAAPHLPAGLRPRVVGGATVVGCCLLDIDEVRPAGAPAIVGQRLCAAAHRISAEWEDRSGTTVTGVFVPARHTASRLAIALGGRWFPGVHARSRIGLAASDHDLRWSSTPMDTAGLGIRACASIPRRAEVRDACEPVADTCLGASIGVSRDHRGALEAVRMEPDHRVAFEVEVEELDSPFLDSFTTRRAAPSYVMRDAGVTWMPAPGPAEP